MGFLAGEAGDRYDVGGRGVDWLRSIKESQKGDEDSERKQGEEGPAWAGWLDGGRERGLGDGIGCGWGFEGDGAVEAVAAAGEGLDEGGLALFRLESTADDGDVLGEVGIVDDAILPDGLDDLLASDDLGGAFGEDEEGFGGFAIEADGFTVLKQDFGDGVEAEGTKADELPFFQPVTT